MPLPGALGPIESRIITLERRVAALEAIGLVVLPVPAVHTLWDGGGDSGQDQRQQRHPRPERAVWPTRWNQRDLCYAGRVQRHSWQGRLAGAICRLCLGDAGGHTGERVRYSGGVLPV